MVNTWLFSMLLHEINLNMSAVFGNEKVLGAGIQGTAFATPRPNEVRKVYGLDNLNDSYYKFIKMIEQHQDNPFFPRIYRHKVYKNKPITVSRISDYSMTGVVMMEKLHPMLGGKIPEEVIRAMFNNLGINIRNFDDISQMFRYKTDMAKRMAETTNDQLAEALRILLGSGRRFFDLHTNNWMVRLTSVGPQLVILDPVYGADANTLPDTVLTQLDLEL